MTSDTFPNLSWDATIEAYAGEDTFGGHLIEVELDYDGKLSAVNLVG